MFRKYKFLFSALLVLALVFLSISSVTAAVGTQKGDYPPGSVVTVSGDTSDGAPYAPGETVHVAASGPNGYNLACDAVADDSGSWSCGLSLAADAPAGDYSYNATGLTSNVYQGGSFTVSAPPTATAIDTPTDQPTASETTAPSDTDTSQATSQPTVVSSDTPAVTEAATTAAPPWIQSDQADYTPSSTVTLTSGGWQPGEAVQVFVNDSIGQTWQITQAMVTDNTGAFTYQFQLPGSFVANYSVTATGAASGVAATTFTDAVGSMSPTSGPEGQSFTLSLVRSGTPAWTTSTKIVFAGTSLTTTFGDSSHISAVVSASLVADEGTKTVSITSPNATAPSFTVTEGDSFTLTPQSISATTNTAFSGTVATLADTYDNTATGTFNATINWGDGSAASAGTITKTGVGAYSIAGSHTYTSQFWSTSVRLATTLPASIIPIANNGTTNFAPSGSLVVLTSNGYQTITYTGKTTGTNTTTFTGVSGGSGTLAVGNPVAQPFSAVSVTVTEASPGTATATTTSPLTVNDGMTYLLSAGPFSTNEGAVYTGSSPFFPGSIATSVFPSVGNYRLLVSNGATSAWYTLYTSGPNNYMYPNSTTGSVVFGDEGTVPYTETLYLNNGVSVATGGSNVTVNDAGLSYFSAVNTYHPVEGASTGSIQVGKFLDSYLGDGDHSADFTVTVHWGDGNSDTLPVVYVGSNAYTVSGSHTYAEEGTYAATYDVLDDGGSHLNGISTATMVVSDPNVSATGATLSTQYGTPLGSPALATFTDPGGAEPNDVTHYSATVNWGGSFGTETGTISFASGTFTVSATVPYNNAGSYSPIVTINHETSTPQSVTDTVEINPAPLTITASSATVTYGDPAPTITPSYSGFIGSDSITTAPTCTTTYTQGSGVSGSPYPTSCMGAVASSNYTIGYVNGKVAVNPASLTITASSATVTYGDPAPAITPSYSGFIGSDNETNSLSAQPTCSTAYVQFFSGVSGSPYPTSCSGAVSTNYSPSYTPGSVTVNPKSLDITANNQSKTYGDTFTFAGTEFTIGAGQLVNGDSVTSVTLTSTGAAATATVNASPYAITPSAAVGTGLGNYTISYHNATIGLTVNPKDASVTADNKSKTFGADNPILTATVSGTVNNDTLSYSLATTAVKLSPVGSYSITVILGSNPNYIVTKTDGTLSIAQATTTTSLTSSANPSTLNQLVTFTATVSPQIAGVPTGSVTFKDGVTVLGTGTLNGAGVATFSTSSLAVNAHSITAVYGGDGNFTSSTSSVLTQKVWYRFDGFLQPINDTAHSLVCSSPCPVSIFKGGSTVPVKFQLKDVNGNVVQSASLPLWVTPVNMGATALSVDETAYTSIPTSGGTYRTDGQQYIYNWGTAKNQTGFWWRIGVTLDDGQTYYVTIGLR